MTDIKKETLQTAYDAISHVEENHRENLYCEIGSACNDIVQLEDRLKEPHIVTDTLGDDIEWQILLLRAMKELEPIVAGFKTWQSKESE